MTEPRHDKTNKMSVCPAKTQISMGIRPVWSESSLPAWRNLGSLATNWADSEDSDQTGRMPRLFWVFAWRTLILLVLSWGGSHILFKQTARFKTAMNVSQNNIVWFLNNWAATRQNKQNGMCAQRRQISLPIRQVWSESSLSAWRKLGPFVIHWAHSEDSDQTGRMLNYYS